MKKIGLIAGSGQFPIVFSKTAQAKGIDVLAVAHVSETDAALEEHVQSIKWIKLGQLGAMIKFFKSHHVEDAVMAGGITKTNMFLNVKPDLKALKVLASMRHTQDDGLLRSVAGALESEGITVRAPTFLLPELLAEPGCWTQRSPTRSEMADVRFGWRIVKEIGRLDIGQTLVVRGGSVMAVEAIDGTDATIRRGGMLGKKNTVVIKASKPTQDLRFDMPAVGVQTIRTMGDVAAGLLVIEADKTLVFDREEMIKLANREGIAILAVHDIE